MRVTRHGSFGGRYVSKRVEVITIPAVVASVGSRELLKHRACCICHLGLHSNIRWQGSIILGGHAFGGLW